MPARKPTPSCARRHRLAAVLCAVALAALIVPTAASAADITGTWDVTGSVAADQTWTFTAGTGVLAGEGGGKSSYTWPMAGTLTGNSVYVKTQYRELNYTAYFKGTVSADGNTMTGTWSTSPSPTPSDSDWTAVRRGSIPGGGGGKRTTGTRVSCNRGPLPTDDFQCTVEVGDGGSSPTNPTGTVTFTSTRGSFRYGAQCALTPTPLSGGVSSCTVTWIPPVGGLEAGNQPDLVAHYPGDATHAASQGTTQPKIAIGYNVPSVATPDACSRAAHDAESVAGKQKVRASAARRRAHAALNTFHYDDAQKYWGDWAYYNAATCKNGLQSLIGHALEAAGVVFPVGANIAVYVDPEPASKTGLYIGTNFVVIPVSYLVYKAGESTVETAGKAQKDPPDRRYKVYATVARTPTLLIRPGRGLSRGAATAVGRLVTAQLKLAATAKALGATIDKAGGALVAKNRTWQGRQIRLALRYERSLVRRLNALPGLRAKAARAARGSRIFTRAQSRRAVLRAQARVKRSGLPRGLRRFLRKLGFSSGELRGLRATIGRAKPGRDLRPYSALADRRLDDAFRMAASYFRIWAASPQVIAASRLR